jgi:hypothetical protein
MLGTILYIGLWFLVGYWVLSEKPLNPPSGNKQNNNEEEL